MFAHVQVCLNIQMLRKKNLCIPPISTTFSSLWISVWPTQPLATAPIAPYNEPLCQPTAKFRATERRFIDIGSIDKRPNWKSDHWNHLSTGSKPANRPKASLAPKKRRAVHTFFAPGKAPKKGAKGALARGNCGPSLVETCGRQFAKIFVFDWRFHCLHCPFQNFKRGWKTNPCNLCGSNDSAKGFSAFSYLGCYSWMCKELHCLTGSFFEFIEQQWSSLWLWLWKAIPDIIQNIISKRCPYVWDLVVFAVHSHELKKSKPSGNKTRL